MIFMILKRVLFALYRMILLQLMHLMSFMILKRGLFALYRRTLATYTTYELMQKKRATADLLIFLADFITFWTSEIEKNFFYKKWAVFVAA